VHKLEAHVLAGCAGMSEEKRLEVKEVLRREAISRSGSFGTAVGEEVSVTNTIERAGKGRGNSAAGSMDYFVARGKLLASFKHRLDLQ
jgi:hypothetical protein